MIDEWNIKAAHTAKSNVVTRLFSIKVRRSITTDAFQDNRVNVLTMHSQLGRVYTRPRRNEIRMRNQFYRQLILLLFLVFDRLKKIEFVTCVEGSSVVVDRIIGTCRTTKTSTLTYI